MEPKVKKLYGSSSAFAFGELVFTKYSSGCLRNILLTAEGLRFPIPEQFMVLGAINEERFEKTLTGKYDRELPIKHELSGGVLFTGRADFVLHPDANKTILIENKSSESKNILNDIIKKGKYKLENLAQAVAYMVFLKTGHGNLIYSYYEKDKKTGEYELKHERCFEITIESNGAINVDGKPSNFTVFDYLQHQKLAVRSLSDDNYMPPRPAEYDSAWSSPCKFCPWKLLCDRYDASEMNKQDFLDEAKKFHADQLSTQK